jgi:hypothetical protein
MPFVDVEGESCSVATDLFGSRLILCPSDQIVDEILTAACPSIPEAGALCGSRFIILSDTSVSYTPLSLDDPSIQALGALLY